MKLVLTTAPPAEAERIARALVEERLCACAQILPAMRSIYRWKGRVEDAEERLILLKTDDSHLKGLEARLKELHPYEVPEFVAMDVAQASPAYSSWLKEILGGGEAS